MGSQKSRTRRLTVVIAISFSFFLAEISVGFYTRSIALVADAFHYLNDVLGFIVALLALKISQRSKYPKGLSFGWQRAELLGAFFNGVFLLALGISISLQSIERFVSLQYVENPKLMLILGCIGLALNLISATFLHEHDHRESTTLPDENIDGTPEENGLPVMLFHAHLSHRHKVRFSKSQGRDLGMMGVLLHVLGDAVNNVGVIIAALVIWRTNYHGRYYADPAMGLVIALMIFMSALPLVKKSGTVLLESLPSGVDLDDVKHDLEAVPGVISVHELHIWRLNQHKALASAHVVVSEESLSAFISTAKIINECFHAYGIHSTTLQPELAPPRYSVQVNPPTTVVGGEIVIVGGMSTADDRVEQGVEILQRSVREAACQINCGTLCAELTCCG